jgi:hypothetical protein
MAIALPPATYLRIFGANANSLVAFNDIQWKKEKMLFFYFVLDTTGHKKYKVNT